MLWMLIMPLESFDIETFKDELFDAVGDYFDQLTAEGEDVQLLKDYAFIRKISNQASDSAIKVSALVATKRDYVENTGCENVCSFLQKVYELISPVRKKLEIQLEGVGQESSKKDEFLTLLIRNHRQQSNQYNGYLVTVDRLDYDLVNKTPAAFDLYRKINQVIASDNSSNRRVQIVVRQAEHYTTLDIDKQRESCFVIDAAGDFKQYNLFDLVSHSPYVRVLYYVNTQEYSMDGISTKQAKMQHDAYSCSVFALDHSLQLAENEGIHGWLQDNAQRDDERNDRFYVN